MQNVSDKAMIVMAIFKKHNIGKNGFMTTYQLSEEKEFMSILEDERKEAVEELLMGNFLSYKTGQLILTEKGYNYLYSEDGKRLRS